MRQGLLSPLCALGRGVPKPLPPNIERPRGLLVIPKPSSIPVLGPVEHSNGKTKL